MLEGRSSFLEYMTTEDLKCCKYKNDRACSGTKNDM